MFYVSCFREDKDTFFAQFITPVISVKNKSLNAPHETWVQSSDLLLSCQLILREGVERQLWLVYTWSLCVLSDRKYI